MVKKIAGTFVRPLRCEHFVGQFEPVSGQDELAASLYVPVGLVFNNLLCPDKVKDALSKTLDVFPEYAGRLNGRHIKNFSAGALYEVAGRPEADALSYTSSRDWERVDALYVIKSLSRPGQNDPLLRIRLSLFPASGLSVLFLVVNHILGDAHSIAQFLHTWSFHCGGDWPAQTPVLQRPLGCRRVLQYAKDKAPKNIADLRAMDPHGRSPLDRVAAAFIMPRLLWAVLRHRMMEIRIDAAGVKEWKTRLTDALPTGAWVSSYEVMFSMLYFAKSIADGNGVHKARPVFPIINARGRVSGPPPDYHGNLVLSKQVMLGASDQVASGPDANTESVANIAAQLHDGLRKILANGEGLAEPMKWTNAVQDLGYATRMNFTLLGDIVTDRGILMNSWYHFPWLDIDMGSGERATKLIFPNSAIHNLWTLMPRDRESGDLTLHISMPKGQAKLFLRTIAELRMPFHLVESFVR